VTIFFTQAEKEVTTLICQDEVLFSRPLYRKVQKGHIPGEDVYSALGQTEGGRYLIVIFVCKQTREALVLSARDMDRKERRQYDRR
jgi:uncharacterized DUF497 family protein